MTYAECREGPWRDYNNGQILDGVYEEDFDAYFRTDLTSFEAKFVRVHPFRWEHHPSLKFNVYTKPSERGPDDPSDSCMDWSKFKNTGSNNDTYNNTSNFTDDGEDYGISVLGVHFDNSTSVSDGIDLTITLKKQ